MNDDGKPQVEYPAEGQTDTNVDCHPESLESFMARLDDSALKLTVLVGVLQVLNGQIITHLYGTGGVVSNREDYKRGPPSMVSLNDDFDTQLEVLGGVVESLVKHVGAFDVERAAFGAVPGAMPPGAVPVKTGGPGSDAHNH